MYYIDLDYTPPTEEEKEEIVEKNKKEFEGKKVVTYTPNFEPVYEDEWKERQNRIPIFRNTEILKNHIEKDGCFTIDYVHRTKTFTVFTVATQYFYVNSLDELTPERFMLEEEKQKQYEKDSSEMFRLSKQNENG
jgi:lysine/ornithine N-monooxygenase